MERLLEPGEGIDAVTWFDLDGRFADSSTKSPDGCRQCSVLSHEGKLKRLLPGLPALVQK